MRYKLGIVDKGLWEKRLNPYPLQVLTPDDKILLDGGLVIFNTIKLNDYPLFLEGALNKINRSYTDYSGVIFGPWKGSPGDETDPPIPAGYVVLGTYSGEAEISDKEFYTLCLQFAEKAIKSIDVFQMKEKGLIDDDWINRVQKTIPQFEKIISKC